MTKEKMYIDTEAKEIYFDCIDHADNKDVCIMCSTLSNVLICACRRANIEPTKDEDGHLTISVPKATDTLISVFKAVQDVFDEVEYQFPFQLKVY